MKKIITSLFLLSHFLIFSQDLDILQEMKNDVKYLASDELEGRFTGTNGEKLAANYIISKFIEQNLLPYGDNNTFFQKFDAKLRENPHSNIKVTTISGNNIVGFYDNNAIQTIVIGAHYDHLGYGHTGSLSEKKDQIHNGADDNASGVSIMLHLIPTLIQNINYNYLFIAFSGEEVGLYGSSFYTKNPTIDLKKVRFMLNFDMVGRLNDNKTLLVNGVGTSSKWNEIIEESNLFDFDLRTTESGFGASDHTSFYNQEIPVLHFFTGQHQDYHKPTDDYDKINYEGMHDIYLYVVEIVKNSTKIIEFDYKETVSESSESPNFTVTLGIMPDYLSDTGGLRIDGVSKDKTAWKAGILKGDIVVKMGATDVTDIMTYMKALSNFESGDSTIVKVLRNDKELTFTIVFD